MLLSTLSAPVTPDALNNTASYIASQQHADGALPWHTGARLDPWDHIEAAMGLSVCGYIEQAQRAYRWSKRQQLSDGSWYAAYFVEDEPAIKESHFTAYIATGVWHHYLITRDREFLNAMFHCVEGAVDWVLALQHPEGEVAWAVDSAGIACDDALVTGCSSILRSLECACKIAEELARPRPQWRRAGKRLAQALQMKPQRFDRTWAPKTRFAMDWFYPILAGLYSPETAQARLNARWHEFVKEGLGCRCVNDEPWVTFAETAELIIALVAADKRESALAMFTDLAPWKTTQGAYQTGYVYTDDAIWPTETTSWTAAAVLLAADALWQLTPAHRLWVQRSAFL